MAIIDLNTLTVLDTGPCAHGKGKGNSAWKPSFSNKEGSRCSSLGAFKIAEKGYSTTVGLRFALDGLDDSNSNARRRNILIHSSRYVGIISPPIFLSPMLRGDASRQALLCLGKSKPFVTRVGNPSYFMHINNLDEQKDYNGTEPEKNPDLYNPDCAHQSHHTCPDLMRH